MCTNPNFLNRDKNKFLLLACLLFLSITTFLACDNVVEAESVNSSKQIRPVITLTGRYNSQTDVYKSTISAFIKNGKGENILIEGGNITVNGFKMEEPNLYLISSNKHEDYRFKGDLIPNKLYHFKITLSNGDVHNAWIHTPEVFPTEMDTTKRVLRNKPLTVVWSPNDFRFPQKLLIERLNKDNDYAHVKTIDLTPLERYKGTYVINGKYLVYQDISQDHLSETRIQLHAKTIGEVDPYFPKGSTISFNYYLYKYIEVF